MPLEFAIARMAVEVRCALTREAIGLEQIELLLTPRGPDEGGRLAEIGSRALAAGRESTAVLAAAHRLLVALSPFEDEVYALVQRRPS